LLLGLKSELAIIFITDWLHVLKNFCNKYILEKGNKAVSGDHHQLLTSANLYSQYWTDLAREGIYSFPANFQKGMFK
jgi:hypothetical protein